MPFVVRVEEGTLDRAVYHIAVLVDPASKRPRWNDKVVMNLGGGSALHHVQRAPANPKGAGSDSSYNPYDNVGELHALGRGFIVATSGFSATSRVHDEVLTTEAIYMVKQRIATAYGPIRYTIGSGCSGGSIQQNIGASGYPGIYDGIQVSCTLSDSVTVLRMVADCHLLVHYFDTKSPQLWGDASQQAAVTGFKDISNCHAWEALFANLLDPSSRNCSADAPPCSVGGISNASSPNACGRPAAEIYNPATNPAGLRCDAFDYQMAIWGPRPPSVWGEVERRLDRGFARRPYDNVGVQYGLQALHDGKITPAQFADLNANIGGLGIDYDIQPQRMVADPGAIDIAFRSSQVFDARPHDDIPILDMRAYSETGDVHNTYHSYVNRARLEAANGDADNQVIWTYPATSPPLPIPGPDLRAEGLRVMDQWLANIERDTSSAPLRDKVRRDKPADAKERCFGFAGPIVAPGAQETDVSVCRALSPGAEPRIVAGEPWRLDVFKCRLKPLQRGDYPVTFSDEDWAKLVQAFPDGVCDYSRPGVGTRRSEPWMSYGGDGPRSLGAAPRSLADSAGLPSTRRCLSRRSFRIRLRARGRRIRSARVWVNGRRVKVQRRGRRLTARVDLRGLTKRTVRVKVRVVTRSGRRIVDDRRYRTCRPGRRS